MSKYTKSRIDRPEEFTIESEDGRWVVLEGDKQVAMVESEDLADLTISLLQYADKRASESPEVVQFEDMHFGDMFWTRRDTLDTWDICRVVYDTKVIHGRLPRDSKVVQWLNGDGVDSLEELFENGWKFVRILPKKR